jgi:integrase/recombinase XerD
MPHDEPQKQRYEPVGQVVRIFLRGKTWWANFQRGGRQCRQSLATTSKKEARRRALLLEARLLEGRFQGRARPCTADQAIAAYLTHLRSEGRAVKTLAKYALVLGRAGELLRSRRAASLLDLDLRAVDAYRQARALAGAAPKTIYTETVVLRQLVNFALARGLVERDPLRGLKILEPRPTPQPCWAPEEVERVLAAAPPGYVLAWTVLADAGLRSAELAHLTWQDVDLGRNVLHVRAKEGWRPKTGDQRAVPMTPRVRALLESAPRPGRWVVTAPRSPRHPRGDGQVSGRRMLKALKRVLARLGLEGHLHTFRHAFISRALTAGVPEAIVREWVGHVDRDVMKLYTHIASAASQAAMRRFAGGGTPSTPGHAAHGGGRDGQGEDPARIQHKDEE